MASTKGLLFGGKPITPTGELLLNSWSVGELEFGAQREPALCLASGMTSEEIALYISECTTLSLWEISQLQQIELFHFGLQMAFSYTSRHINLITNDHIFH